MIANEVVNQGINYILQHINENITVEDVADYCHFSKYYFSRLFKAQTGESVYAFIKRTKVEQSAFRLKVERERSITDVGAEYGYSSSNHCDVFKQSQKVSPIAYRRSIKTADISHPFFTKRIENLETYEQIDNKTTIKELKEIRVVYERFIGSYYALGEVWGRFLNKYRDYFTDQTVLIECSYDDPTITNIENCMCDICFSIDKDCPLDNVMTIPGGKFAVYDFEGSVIDIFAAFQGIYTVWLPQSKYTIDERYGYAVYRKEVDKTGMVRMDLCTPVY